MKNIRTRILAFLAMAALVLGLAGVSTASAAAPSVAAPRPAVTATSYTDCGQSAFLGTRVCLDQTTGYGPVVLIYTSGSGVYTSFGVSTVGIASPTSFVATPLEYLYGSVTGYPGSDINFSSATGFATNQIVTNGDVNALNLLNYFGNQAGYEFVIAN